jgi:hypothetical protein
MCNTSVKVKDGIPKYHVGYSPGSTFIYNTMSSPWRREWKVTKRNYPLELG